MNIELTSVTFDLTISIVFGLAILGCLLLMTPEDSPEIEKLLRKK